MSEKDLQEETIEAATDDLIVEQIPSEVEDSKETSDQSESPQEEMEESRFLREWKERHAAYQRGQLLEEEGDKGLDDAKLSELKYKKQESTDKVSQNRVFVKKDKEPLPNQVMIRALPIFLVAVITLLMSLYFVTPLGTYKKVRVTGNHQVSSDSIVKKSQISSKDYLLTTVLYAADYANNIKNSNPWIKSANLHFDFPYHLVITVEEYKHIGYVQQGENYYSVLSSGEVVNSSISEQELPEYSTIIRLSDRELIKSLVHQLVQLDPDLLGTIQEISLSPSKATNDLLSLEMKGGNQILVPLTEISFKVPYYSKIARQLMFPSVVDMEVGIYSYPRTE